VGGGGGGVADVLPNVLIAAPSDCCMNPASPQIDCAYYIGKSWVKGQ